MTKVVLNEQDATRLLQALYNGRRPTHVHTLVCLCGATADLRKSPCAWNGWQILPHAKCPSCARMGPTVNLAEGYPAGARARFDRLVDELILGTVT